MKGLLVEAVIEFQACLCLESFSFSFSLRAFCGGDKWSRNKIFWMECVSFRFLLFCLWYRFCFSLSSEDNDIIERFEQECVFSVEVKHHWTYLAFLSENVESRFLLWEMVRVGRSWVRIPVPAKFFSTCLQAITYPYRSHKATVFGFYWFLVNNFDYDSAWLHKNISQHSSGPYPAQNIKNLPYIHADLKLFLVRIASLVPFIEVNSRTAKWLTTKPSLSINYWHQLHYNNWFFYCHRWH